MQRWILTLLTIAFISMNAHAASEFWLPEGDEALFDIAEAVLDGDTDVITPLSVSERRTVAQIIWEIVGDGEEAYAISKDAGLFGVEEFSGDPRAQGLNFYPRDWKFPFHRSSKITVGYDGNICDSRDRDYYHTGNERFALDWSRVAGDGDIGDHIVAPASGYATAYFSDRGYGNHIRVDAGNGYSYLIAHLDKITLNNCGWINRGQHLGTLGCTGSCFGAHIHFVVYRHGRSVEQNGISGHNDLRLCEWYDSRQ